MNFRRITFICFCLFVVQDLVAQVYYIDPRFYRGQRAFHQVDQPIVFDLFPYSNSILDMRGFQLMHPEIARRIPEYIEVAPPDISELHNISFAVAWVGVQEGGEADGYLLLMIVGNYTDQQPRYYVDRNLDRVFVNDGDPVVFFPGHTREEIVFRKENSEEAGFSFWLLAPEDFAEVEYQKQKAAARILLPDQTPSSETPVPGQARVISHADSSQVAAPKLLPPPQVRRIGIRFGLTFGVNRISYSYLKATSGFPVTYEVSNSAKGLFVNGNYRHRGFRAGLSAGLEHMLWWSSFKTTRVSDPFEICDPQTGVCRHVEGVEVERNRDRMPQLRLNLGVNLEYLFEVMPRIRVGPYIMPAFSSYRPARYLPEVIFPDETFRMGPDFSFEGGIRAEVRPTDDQAFIFSACWSEARFRPSGFFEHERDIRLAGLYSQFRGIRAYLGYSILL